MLQEKAKFHLKQSFCCFLGHKYSVVLFEKVKIMQNDISKHHYNLQGFFQNIYKYMVLKSAPLNIFASVVP